MSNLVLHPAVMLLFPAAMAFAASMDLFTMTIPNRVSLVLTGAYFALALAMGVPYAEVLSNLSCGFAILAGAFAMFAMGWIGGGDAKLAAATALWLGWGKIFDYGVTAALLGGALTIVIILMRKVSLPDILSKQAWIARLHDAKAGVPYGLALAAAGLIIYPQSQIFLAGALR